MVTVKKSTLNTKTQELKVKEWEFWFLVCHARGLEVISHICVVHSSYVQLFATPWTAVCQAYLSLTVSRSLPKFMSTESAVPSNHLILRCPLLLLPSIFPNLKIFFSESALCIRWPKSFK